MNITDIRTRVEAGIPAQTETSRLVLRTTEPDEKPAVKLIDTAQPNAAESTVMPDPLIQALVDRLPKPNSIWSIEDRAKWLRAVAIIFNLVYRTRDGEREQPSSTKKTEEKPVRPAALDAVS